MSTTLSERIKERLAATRMNNAQLAAAAGVKPPTSFNWANGRTKHIKGEPLLKAAAALGVTPEWLATGTGRKFTESLYVRHTASETIQPYREQSVIQRGYDALPQEGRTELLRYLEYLMLKFTQRSVEKSIDLLFEEIRQLAK